MAHLESKPKSLATQIQKSQDKYATKVENQKSTSKIQKPQNHAIQNLGNPLARKNITQNLSLYLVASREERSDEEFLGIVDEALQGGVGIVQLREKHLSSHEFYALACKLKALCDRHSTPLIINDRIDIALACGASGAHIGVKNDLPVQVARRILGEDKILGVSVNQLNEVDELAKDLISADYLGVGAIYPTQSKADALIIGIDGLASIIEQVAQKISKDLPIVAIGGINEANIHSLAGANIAGVAVISAIMNSPNPKQAAQNLKQSLKPKSKP